MDSLESSKRVRNEIFLQGKLLIVRAYLSTPREGKPHYRKEIKLFSQGSRFRLLKKIARIDWSKLPQGLFVTLTYPDAQAKVETKTATMHRHHWIRYMENYLCEHIPILWRKEQQVRKSGIYKGIHVQHYHLCVFTGKTLPHKLVRDWWRRTIKAEGPLATDVKRMDSGEHAAFYLAKYLSKRQEVPSLDYAAYLTKPGRAWGFHRENLIPLHPLDSMLGLTEEQYAGVLAIARKHCTKKEPECWDSFTLIGPTAEAAKQEILEFLS